MGGGGAEVWFERASTTDQEMTAREYMLISLVLAYMSSGLLMCHTYEALIQAVRDLHVHFCTHSIDGRPV